MTKIRKLFPQDELYYSTELSDYEDNSQDEAHAGGDKNEVHMISPSHDRSPSPPLRSL